MSDALWLALETLTLFLVVIVVVWATAVFIFSLRRRLTRRAQLRKMDKLKPWEDN